MKKQVAVPLVITTAHKGVFFGYGQPTTEKIIRVDSRELNPDSVFIRNAWLPCLSMTSFNQHALLILRPVHGGLKNG